MVQNGMFSWSTPCMYPKHYLQLKQCGFDETPLRNRGGLRVGVNGIAFHIAGGPDCAQLGSGPPADSVANYRRKRRHTATAEISCDVGR